jgi:hypothetical protein
MTPPHASRVPASAYLSRIAISRCRKTVYIVLRMIRSGPPPHTAVRDPEMIAPPLHRITG